MARRGETGDIDSKSGREERARAFQNAATGDGPPGSQVEDDTLAVGPSALRGKIASFGPFRLYLTERLLEKCGTAAPQVHILVTSREALRAEGEQVHHLPPLECPPYTES